ncbi:hypothetical protein QBC47DRAFT_351784 [Echria macrotheca]|uniref:Rhodopsin domain-containing protein n=1 Tax=Echria macrotheca TaxID=438768 RepID=A0AAJ0B3K0_9PEZI|nr:hypothetical protein QBC47DRAFT_351784 [Echria macrotheca]
MDTFLLDEKIQGRAACPRDDPDDVYNRRLFALVPTVIIMVLTVITYALRLYCRKRTAQKLWWDDLLMGIGVLISLEPAICQLLLLQNGLGHHVCNVPPDQAARFARISFALQRANQPALACIRLSIVIFYMRIFTTRNFRIAAHCVNAYTIAWAISTWIVNLTVCTPIAFYYDRTIPGGGSCRNQAVSGSISGGLSLLGDILVLALPVPVIWRLRIDTRRRIGIICVFLLGVFVCVASTIRIIELTKFVVTDPTYTQVQASTWTTLEQGVAVVSGNLPLLTPLFERYLRRGNTTSGYSGSGSGSGYMFGSKGRKTPGAAQAESVTADKYRPDKENPKLNFHDEPGITTVSAHPRRPGPPHDMYRLSDEESQTGTSDSAHGIELDDRAILVKTQVSVTQSTSPMRHAQEGSWLKT